MTEPTDDVRIAVHQVLTAKGLPVTDAERESLERSYPILQRMTAALRIPETRYAEPAPIYPATLDR